eukprot:JP440127.1.p1 GENE.JP440127.1~~JP440127.1.p1  ORF type:complete len:71 (+),score=20.29 JP440127.1:25-237(+)
MGKFASAITQILYGPTAAAMYEKAASLNKQARSTYEESANAYFQANSAAAYDDMKRARAQWDYFYNRKFN